MHRQIWITISTRCTTSAFAVALAFFLAFAPSGLGSEHVNIVSRRSEGAAVEEAAADSEITSGVRAASLLRSRHLAFLGADRWHAAGFRGQGIKVAILDSGFRGYRSFLGRALPEHVTVHSCRSDGNLEAKDSIHGILCGEVVHALAPDAELLFANWEPDRPDQFIDAVRWARGQGARVLSCSLIMPSWSDGEGGGPTHAALAELLASHGGPADAVCFASAGNTAQRHWSGVFHDGAAHFHEWEQGRTENELSPWGNEPVSVELCWHAAGDFDLIVDDRTMHEEVARSLAQKALERVCAVARFQPRPCHDYDVRVRLAGGTPGTFHLVALGGYLQSTTSQGSIPFPADGPEVIAVGAVGADGHRAPYSSCGPNSPCPKPDLVALVPFPTICRTQSFSGTSAASPQAAALAALWWSKYPNWAATQIRHALQASAHDLGPPGHDYETGYGLISLP